MEYNIDNLIITRNLYRNYIISRLVSWGVMKEIPPKIQYKLYRQPSTRLPLEVIHRILCNPFVL